MHVTMCYRCNLKIRLLLLLLVMQSTDSQCAVGVHIQTSPSQESDIKQNTALEGYVIETFSLWSFHQCFSKCMKNCQCLSYNFSEEKKTENCELNDANTHLAPEALKAKRGVKYYQPVRQYYNSEVTRQTSSGSSCQTCCESAPCLNGGTCHEVCDVNNRRFNCTCPPGFTGYKCHVVRPSRSCKDVMVMSGIQPANGVFSLVDDKDIAFPVYCDFNSEPGAAWTLIQSHALSNNHQFKNKPFFVDAPVNHNAPEWDSYRLSLHRMKLIWNSSTHWRATCNFQIDGIDYRDYARAFPADGGFNVFAKPTGYLHCALYEYLNIRGNQCVNCTALTVYSGVYPLHIDSWDFDFACEFNGRPNGGIFSEDNFGFYEYANRGFRCSTSNEATSQFWFGHMRPQSSDEQHQLAR